MEKWSVVYERAIREDGSLLFPERLTQEFLDNARRTMGSFFLFREPIFEFGGFAGGHVI